MVIHVNMTDVRPHLSELIGKAEHGQDRIVFLRFGQRVAALVSMADLARIEEAIDEETLGPRDPETGRRPGNALIRASDVLKGLWG